MQNEATLVSFYFLSSSKGLSIKKQSWMPVTTTYHTLTLHTFNGTFLFIYAFSYKPNNSLISFQIYRGFVPGVWVDQRWRGRQPWARRLPRIRLCTFRIRCRPPEQQLRRRTFSGFQLKQNEMKTLHFYSSSHF